MKLPQDIRDEWMAVMDRSLTDPTSQMLALESRAPELADALKRAQMLKNLASVEKVIAAKQWSDISERTSASKHKDFEKKLLRIADEIIDVDFAKGQAFIAVGLRVIDHEWVVRHWQGLRQWNGWTPTSELFENWMKGTKNRCQTMMRGRQ